MPLLLLLAAATQQQRLGGCVFEHAAVLHLDGKTCALRAEGAAAALPMGSAPYTLQAEIQTTTGGQRGIISWGDYTTSAVNAFRLDGDAGQSLVNYWFSNDLVSPASPPLHLADGKWHAIAAIWDGTTQSLVADGRQVASRKPAAKLDVKTKSNFCVGASSEQYDAKFSGQIRAVRIWSEARGLDQLDEACAPWGRPFLWLVLVGGGCYFGGGVLYGRRSGGGGGSGRAASTKAGQLAAAHPHWPHWLAIAGLVKDGAEYTRRRARGGGGGGGGSGQRPAQGEARSPPRNAGSEDTQGSKKEKKKDKQKHKTEKQKKQKAEKQETGQPPPTPEGMGVGDQDGGSNTAPLLATPAGGGGRWVHVT
eukprot:SAG22_NODE_946_length_6371_cov_12.683833_7_plen_364_part_00